MLPQLGVVDWGSSLGRQSYGSPMGRVWDMMGIESNVTTAQSAGSVEKAGAMRRRKPADAGGTGSFPVEAWSHTTHTKNEVDDTTYLFLFFCSWSSFHENHAWRPPPAYVGRSERFPRPKLRRGVRTAKKPPVLGFDSTCSTKLTKRSHRVPHPNPAAERKVFPRHGADVPFRGADRSRMGLTKWESDGDRLEGVTTGMTKGHGP